MQKERDRQEIRIRALEEKDVPAVAEIERSVFPLPWSEKAFLDALSDPYALFLVAELPEEERVIAYVGMYIVADEGEITNVCTAVDDRKRGAADRLFEELLLIAREKGLSQLVLEVRVSNAPAIGLYQKKGFRTVGIRKGFYELPKEDAYMMIMRL